jgi:hypothetical protein
MDRGEGTFDEASQAVGATMPTRRRRARKIKRTCSCAIRANLECAATRIRPTLSLGAFAKGPSGENPDLPLGETGTPSSSRADMTETPRTIVVKDPSSAPPVAFRRAVSGDIGDELRRLYGSSSSACRLGAGVSGSCRCFQDDRPRDG